MSKHYSLNLYQNAIDSLNEGMIFYNVSLNDESKYKFCIITITHFSELLLKHLVELQNPLLCYVEPYTSKLEEAKTITWWQAYKILVNCSLSVSSELKDSMERLSKFRNTIVHHKVNYNTTEIRKIILDVVDGLRSLYKSITGKDFFNDVLESTQVILTKIEDEYAKELLLAQAEAKEEVDETGTEIARCSLCGGDDTAIYRNEGEYYCFLCDEIDEEVTCARCGEIILFSDANKFGETPEGDELYFCEYCSDYIEHEYEP
jgi:hypothetical protein